MIFFIFEVMELYNDGGIEVFLRFITIKLTKNLINTKNFVKASTS